MRITALTAAIMALGLSAEGLAQQQPAQQSSGQIQEIVVTAEKKQEDLLNVPVPVTALDPSSLVDQNWLRMEDYATAVPALNVSPIGFGTQFISIRGITTGGGTPTVGILIDDIPFGSSTFLGGGQAVPDIDPGDLARIEVLRGPQGTLYGASSIGGLIKYVTIDPSTDGVSGHAQAGVSTIENASDLGYNVRGSVNLPLSDTIAVRASGFTREDPGYIDNPLLNEKGVNEERVYGGRLSALWRPSDVFSLKLSALYQDTKVGGQDEVETESALGGGPGAPPPQLLGDLQQGFVAGTGSAEDKTQAYGATVLAKLGSADLTFLSGYSVHSGSAVADNTYALGGLLAAVFGVPVAGAGVDIDIETRKVTEELRLNVPLGAQVDWLIGGFYTHERTDPFTDTILGLNPSTGALLGNFGAEYFPSTLEEYSGFTDVTIRFTDQFDIQLGGRESHFDQSAGQTTSGTYAFLLSGGTTMSLVSPEVNTSSNAFTYLVTPRFQITPDLMVYARAASGYRAGGPNVAPGTPTEYVPDKTENYELGLKGSFLDHTLSVDTSLYYIDWNNIQLTLLDTAIDQTYTGNGGKAKSEGLELSVESKPLTGLTIDGWVAWNEAVLTQTLPATATVVGVPGDRLPYSARISGSLIVEQRFPLTRSVTGFVSATENYVGDRLTSFGTSEQRQIFPAYATTNLRLGAQYQTWTYNVYANNLADRRGVIQGGSATGNPAALTLIRPREIGLTVAKTF